jgi:ubiquinone/menaquinone biosynthesis C-methylase UbiE
MAMGPHRAARTLAQASNVVPPVPQLYERLWRKRSLSLLSGRPFPLTEELRELCEEVQPAADRVIVDVACSEGTYARCLAEHASAVIAVDHSMAFLRRLSHRSADLAIAPVRALAQHLPIRSGAVRAVVMGGSLNEIGDQAAAAAEMVRILGHEGRLFSMSLVQRPRQSSPSVMARTRAKVGAATSALSGVVVPTEAATVELFERAGLVIDSHRRDGSVLRIAGQRR